MVAGMRKVVVEVAELLMRPVLRLLDITPQPATLIMQIGNVPLFITIES